MGKCSEYTLTSSHHYVKLTEGLKLTVGLKLTEGLKLAVGLKSAVMSRLQYIV